MRNLFAFIYRHHVFFMFLFLEIIAVGMLVKNNDYQNSRFASSSNVLSGKIFQHFKNISDYFYLQKINQLLVEENTLLKNLNLKKSFDANNINNKGQYEFISAKIIKNSYNKRNNYLTINKGAMDGIESGMGVCVNEGVVGIVRDVSKHFSTIMSLLNKKAIISSRFTKSNHFGVIQWDGKSYHFAQLHSIPKYVDVSLGDSLITNSFSNIFPEGISLGTVNRFERDKNDNFYAIEVALSVDFSNINYVYVIKDLFKDERLKLEKKLNE